MDFAKYPTIRDYADTRARDEVAHAVPATARWVVLEKIDGANLQLAFAPRQAMRIGRRNAWLGDGEAFFGVRDILARHADALGRMQAWADVNDRPLRLFCELFAPQILGRIPYGEGVVVLDIWHGDQLLAPDDALAFLEQRGLSRLYVPRLAVVDGWDALCVWLRDSFRVGPRSALAPPDASGVAPVAEGVVVRPSACNYKMSTGYAMMKHKTAAFLEVAAVAKAPCPLQDAFRAYITPSRVASVVSKLGAPPDRAAIGKTYNPALRADALEDFVRDHPTLSVDDLARVRRCRVNAFHAFLEHLR
jgi:hypothetical protein